MKSGVELSYFVYYSPKINHYTTVGLNKAPMKGHAPLTKNQRIMVNDNWDYIENLIRRVWPR